MNMSSQLYHSSGYINMEKVIKMGYTFTFVTGARRIGKTYGCITYNLDNDIPFVYMRRTQKEINACKSDQFSPFTDINMERENTDIQAKSLVPDVIGFYDKQKDNKLICPGIALTTFHNVRGISGAQYKQILYDEFIPEKIARPITGEFDAWSNAYETLNSNRELKGSSAIQFINLANSNAAANPIFMGLGLVRVLEKIKNEKRELWTDDRRGILLVNAEASPISERKKKTALGKLTQGTDFYKMAYDNEYAFDDFSNIVSRSLKEYKPIVEVGEITIYQHKGRKEYYISTHTAGTAPKVYGSNEREIDAFSRSAGKLRDAYLDGVVWFENFLAKVLFLKYTNY